MSNNEVNLFCPFCGVWYYQDDIVFVSGSRLEPQTVHENPWMHLKLNGCSLSWPSACYRNLKKKKPCKLIHLWCLLFVFYCWLFSDQGHTNSRNLSLFAGFPLTDFHRKFVAPVWIHRRNFSKLRCAHYFILKLLWFVLFELLTDAWPTSYAF